MLAPPPRRTEHPSAFRPGAGATAQLRKRMRRSSPRRPARHRDLQPERGRVPQDAAPAWPPHPRRPAGRPPATRSLPPTCGAASSTVTTAAAARSADRPGGGQTRNASADDHDMHVSPQLMDELDDSGEHAGIGVGQHPVAEVEDVPVGGVPFGHDPPYLRVDNRPVREQQRRVEVALQHGRPGRSGARPRRAAPASRRRRRRPRPRASARAARRSRRRSGCAGTPRPASDSSTARLCGSTNCS